MLNRPPRTLTLQQFGAEIRTVPTSAARDGSPGSPPSPAGDMGDMVDRRANIYQEGVVAGLLGGAAIALWFFFLDLLQGRPFYTPSVLGSALFRPGELPAMSLETVFLFTGVHALAFGVIGGVAAQLLAVAQRVPHAGFGVLLLFVALEIGFLVPSMLLAHEILHALAWPAVLIGNFLAAGALGGYLWRRHPRLRVDP